jgi:hypothetical protein
MTFAKGTKAHCYSFINKNKILLKKDIHLLVIKIKLLNNINSIFEIIHYGFLISMDVRFDEMLIF